MLEAMTKNSSFGCGFLAADLLPPLVWIGTLILVGISHGAWGANQILLSGNVLQKCTLATTPDANASNLALSASGTQRIRIGTVLQDCNGRTDYTIQVFSSNCLATPVGAKVVGSVSADYLPYSVEAENPTTGGSAPLVTGLLSSACVNQVARDVTHGNIKNESSTLFISYTGSSLLSAGTYQDTLTITLSAK